VVNPLIVDGQVHGGLAQGIAQALYEEAVHDADGNLLTTTLADYLLPSAADLPAFTTGRTETPATSNPLGVKGVGETGATAAPQQWSTRSSTHCAPTASATSACRAPPNAYGKPSSRPPNDPGEPATSGRPRPSN
jgi:hypothetical protein